MVKFLKLSLKHHNSMQESS